MHAHAWNHYETQAKKAIELSEAHDLSTAHPYQGVFFFFFLLQFSSFIFYTEQLHIFSLHTQLLIHYEPEHRQPAHLGHAFVATATRVQAPCTKAVAAGAALGNTFSCWPEQHWGTDEWIQDVRPCQRLRLLDREGHSCLWGACAPNQVENLSSSGRGFEMRIFFQSDNAAHTITCPLFFILLPHWNYMTISACFVYSAFNTSFSALSNGLLKIKISFTWSLLWLFNMYCGKKKSRNWYNFRWRRTIVLSSSTPPII